MTRSALIKSLRRAYKIARASIKSGIPPEELLDVFNQRTSRRRLLYGGLTLASALGAATWEFILYQVGLNAHSIIERAI